MTKKNALIATTSFTALFVAMCAAVFSVTGIAKLYAGAALSVAVMASALELGKLVSISFLYQYWEQIPRLLKTYLTVAAIILMAVTSAGIYGYLSAGYASVSATPLKMSADVKNTQTRMASVESDIARQNARLSQLLSLRAQQENRLDSLIAKNRPAASVRGAQASLTEADRNVTAVQREISRLSDIRDSLSSASVLKQVEIDTNADIGTFVYISKMLGVSLDTVVKWFTLIIVIVFDPLAVALVIAVNFLLKAPSSQESVENYKVYAPVEESPESPEESKTAPPPSSRVASYLDL
jgi:hypothetical protein